MGSPSHLLGPFPEQTHPGYQVKTSSPHFLENPTAEEMAKLIPQVVDPTSWSSEEGLGTIQALHSSLVIRQKPENHRKVQELLNAVYTGR